MSDDKVIKGVVKGLGQLGVETVEKLGEEGQKILESTITGKDLLGLERTMNEGELELKRHEDNKNKADEIKRLRNEMGQNGKEGEEKPKEKRRDVEEEMEELRQKKEKEEEEKEKYFEQMKKQKEAEKQQQEAEYNDLTMESSNPAKQKKSRGSAFIQKKKKSQPTQSQMSQTQEFKGKLD
jgi:type IV secretory pathway VirB10-like protein